MSCRAGLSSAALLRSFPEGILLAVEEAVEQVCPPLFPPQLCCRLQIGLLYFHFFRILPLILSSFIFPHLSLIMHESMYESKDIIKLMSKLKLKKSKS